MPQLNIFLEKEEDRIVEKYHKEWKLSKAETIKSIIKKFDKEVKE